MTIRAFNKLVLSVPLPPAETALLKTLLPEDVQPSAAPSLLQFCIERDKKMRSVFLRKAAPHVGLS